MRVLLLVLLVALAACGGDQSAPAEEPSPTPEARPTQTQPGGSETVTGRLGGDAELEGGCAWLDAGGTKWQVQYPEGWQVSFDPLTLTGPEGQSAAEGDTVTVTGAEQPDVMTTCQVGPVWAATDVTLED